MYVCESVCESVCVCTCLSVCGQVQDLFHGDILLTGTWGASIRAVEGKRVCLRRRGHKRI